MKITAILLYLATTFLWLWWGWAQSRKKNRLEKELRELRKNFLIYKGQQESSLQEMRHELRQLKESHVSRTPS